MDQEEQPEIGRFQPKGDRSEPREPFLPDKMFQPPHEAPSITSLHVPSTPLTKEKLKNFLLELRPIVKEIHAMSREDQHLVGKYLQDLKEKIQTDHFSDDAKQHFDKLVHHFNELLTHSRPMDRDAVLEKIEQLEIML